MLVALARNLAGPDLILLAGMTVFMALGSFGDTRFPAPRELAASFGNEGLLAVGVLFIVAAGLTQTGGLRLVTERLLGRPTSVPQAQVRMMLPVAGISAFLNNTPVVAMFMPIVNDWCKRTGISPAKLFIPLSYAAVLGGMCTLIGTSTNLVIQGFILDILRTDPDAPLQPLGMFTLGTIGLPAAAVGITFILLTSRFLLPHREGASAQLSDPRQYTVEMMVQPNSSIDGQTIEKAGLRHLPGAYLMEIQRDDDTLVAVGPEQVLRGGDRLIFAGVVESITELQKIRGLLPATDQVFKLDDPRPQRCLVEAVVSNTRPLVGKTIREGRFRTRYNAAVIAVHRNGERIDRKIGDIVLHPGDTLLLETHPRFLHHHRDSRDFYLVSAVENSDPPRHDKAWIAALILVGLVVVLAMESLPWDWVPRISVFTAGLIAAGLMLLLGCISTAQARRSIQWQVLIAIGAALAIGRTMDATGAAAALSGWLMKGFDPWGAWGVLLGVYLVTLLLTEIVTNNAAAALAFPIARAAAESLGVDFMPFAVIIAIAASAGFATPIGYQTHLMVYGPGGYRFSDFLRIGIPMDLLIMATAVTLTPLVFPFAGS